MAGCHGTAGTSPLKEGFVETTDTWRVALVGTPNVGKSVLFNSLTGAYVTVSNYPGTTVELTRGRGVFMGKEAQVVDTPGMYSLHPITEEERVSRQLLLTERPDVLLHVVDGRNLARMLPLTLELLEAGLPVLLVVNMLDEVERVGVKLDLATLAEELGIPVVGAVATAGSGTARLREELAVYRPPLPRLLPRYDSALEAAIEEVAAALEGRYLFSRRAISLLLLEADEEIRNLVCRQEGENAPRILAVLERVREELASEPIVYRAARARHTLARQLVERVTTSAGGRTSGTSGFADWLGRVTMHPLWGLPVLIVVLYFGLYRFVGVFGAGTVVDFLEGRLFEGYVNPWLNGLITAYIPWPWLQELLGLDYGILTLALRYAVAIILPIVGSFFLVFSIIEDSGYLPRLALLIDRVFKHIGLSGRAVIPMTLGFGCDTMATMVSRTLETRRERVIATLLLALAIPCSAQLGVILALLSQRPGALTIWAGFMLLVFLLVGWLSAQILPGRTAHFYMEVPPLRLPRFSNVLVKTLTRMQWYVSEVVPLFVLASVLIWLGRLTGAFGYVESAIVPLVNLLGLPDEAATAFLFGFFRRDYGAAGLYDLAGSLDGVQLTVAATTLTLFVPCIAQFTMMIKERGVKTALAISGFILPFAFLAGYLLNLVLAGLGVSL